MEAVAFGFAARYVCAAHSSAVTWTTWPVRSNRPPGA